MACGTVLYGGLKGVDLGYGACLFGQRKTCHNAGARSSGFDLHFSTKVMQALLHPSDAHAGPARLNLCETFLRDSLAIVAYLDLNTSILALETNAGAVSARMAMDICQALLRHAEDCKLHVT